MPKEPRAFLNTFRDLPCEACGAMDGTIVGAHCNMDHGSAGGKYWGAVAALCFDCHYAADQRGGGSREEALKIWVRVAQTLMLKRYGEWIDDRS